MSTIREQLLDEIEAFLARHGMSPGDFGLACRNNTHLVYRLRRGMDPKASSVDEIRRWMREHERPLARRGRRESRPAA